MVISSNKSSGCILKTTQCSVRANLPIDIKYCLFVFCILWYKGDQFGIINNTI